MYDGWCDACARSRCATPAATSKLSLLKRAARANRDQAVVLLVKRTSPLRYSRFARAEWLLSWQKQGCFCGTSSLCEISPHWPPIMVRDESPANAVAVSAQHAGRDGWFLCHLNPAGAPPAGETASLPNRRSSRRTPVEETTWTATSRPARQSRSRPAAIAPQAASTNSSSSRSGL